MSVQGINIASAMNSLKAATQVASKPTPTQTTQSAAAEEAMESPATEAREGEKGGNINVYA